MFHTEEYGHGRKTYNSGVCIKGSTYSEFEVDYYGKLEEVIELQYHNEQNKVFLFKCYWYDTTGRGIRVDPHYGLVEINSKARHRNVNDVFVFAKQCQHRRHYRRPLPTELPTDRACLTRVRLHHHRRHFRRIADGSKSLAGFSNFFGAHFN